MAERTDSSTYDAKIKDAIKTAERLFGEIKDIRDELNILKSIANHQNSVQNKLMGKGSAELDLTASYITNDITEMDNLANRIQSAVSRLIDIWKIFPWRKGRGLCSWNC